MLLSVHTIAGALIGEKINNPYLAFSLGLISHFLLDMIPHGDLKRPTKLNNFIYIALGGLADLSILGFFLIYFDLKNLLNLNVLLAILGSLLPDLVFIFYRYRDKKYFKSYFNFHEKLHNTISKNFDLKFNWGLILQILIILTLTKIIL